MHEGILGHAQVHPSSNAVSESDKRDNSLRKADSRAIRVIGSPGVGESLFEILPLAMVNVVVARPVRDLEGRGCVLGGHSARPV